jgi:hypothetical protein
LGLRGLKIHAKLCSSAAPTGLFEKQNAGTMTCPTLLSIPVHSKLQEEPDRNPQIR